MVRPFYYKYKFSSKMRVVLGNFNKINNFKKRKWNWFRFKFSQNNQKKWQALSKESIFSTFQRKNNKQIKDNFFTNNFSKKSKRFYRFFFINCLYLRHLLKNSYSFLKNKQLKTVFFNSRSKNLPNNNFLKQINLRSDAILYHFLYHLNYFQSFFHLRQFIIYNGFLVNGKLCNNPNYKLKENDIIELQQKDKVSIFLFLFKTRFCNWLKFYQKQLLVLKEFRKNKLEKRIYMFFLIRKIWRQKYLKSIYKMLSFFNSSNLKVNLLNLNKLLKEFKFNELKFEYFKYKFFFKSINRFNFFNFYIINKKFINKINFYCKFYFFIHKIEWKINWLNFLETKIKNDYKSFFKDKSFLTTNNFFIKEKLLKRILSLKILFSKFLLNLSKNFFKNILEKNQMYSFLHIEYSNLSCIILNEKFKQ